MRCSFCHTCVMVRRCISYWMLYCHTCVMVRGGSATECFIITHVSWYAVDQLLNALLSHMCHGTRWISCWVPDWCVGLPVYQLLGIGGSVTTFKHVHAKLDQENFQRMARSRTSHRNWEGENWKFEICSMVPLAQRLPTIYLSLGVTYWTYNQWVPDSITEPGPGRFWTK